MFSLRGMENNIVLTVYKHNRTVFRLNDIALLTGEMNFQSLNKKLNYHVRTGKLQNPRKGLYAKPGYSREELACTVYTPSYISLEYVLQRTGIVFQYDTHITSASYLSRTIEVDDRGYRFRKIKGSILVNTMGITNLQNGVNMASAERALLDLLYLDKEYCFDNLSPLDRERVYQLLPLYQSKTLSQRVAKLLKNG
jgi:hypothetical protein